MSKTNVGLTGYREAMVFIGSGTEWTGCKLANISYAKQLLVCLGKDINPDSFNVSEITRMFLEEETFKHLHELFKAYGTVSDLHALIDMMHEELCKYVDYEDLDYEPEDERIWWSELKKKTIECVSRDISVEMGAFLNNFETNKLLYNLWWPETDVLKCTGYAWLGKNAAIKYGYETMAKRYSDTFLEWCKKNFITDRDSEMNRLCALFKVRYTDKLDELLQMNMVD